MLLVQPEMRYVVALSCHPHHGRPFIYYNSRLERNMDYGWHCSFPPDRQYCSYPVTISQNKTLSDNTDEVLRLQGVSWLKRRAIGLAVITLRVRHYKGDDGVERIDIDQLLTGRIPGSSENRILDWTFREQDDNLFGPVLGKVRRANLDEIENEFLRKGWLPDTVRDGVINSYVKSDTPKSHTSWIAEQVRQPFQHACLQNGLPIQTWGFEEINNERRYVRHVDFIGPENEHIQARLVYDFREHILPLGRSVA